MNTVSDTRSNEQDQVESGRQDAKPAADARLVELGKVSDTKGAFTGRKADTGFGFQNF